jgi:hypothetical protein
MRVMICLEFDGVDCDSEEADAIIEAIEEDGERMVLFHGASTHWVDDAFNTEERK